MSNEPPAERSRSAISELFDPEQECAMRCLRKQARLLGSTGFRCTSLDLLAVSTDALPAPRKVYILDDGRALAWFGEDRPYVVHPSFVDLCRMHGLRGALVHAHAA